jgi:hypothetical protein
MPVAVSFCRAYRTGSATRHAGSGSRTTTRPLRPTERASLRSGPARVGFREATGRSCARTRVFFVDHSDVRKPLPVRISISGLHLTVPAATRMHGISVLGHEVTLSGLAIDGAPSPMSASAPARRAQGNVGPRRAHRLVALRRQRDVVSIFGAVGLRVAAISSPVHAGGAPRPAYPGGRSRPADTRRARRREQGRRQAGPGIFLDSRRRTACRSSHRESSSSATSSSGMRGRPA